MASCILQQSGTMRRKFFYFITLFILAIPTRVYSFFFIAAIIAAIIMTRYQEVEKPVIMDTWGGFFQPTIKVKSTVAGNNGVAYLAPGQCEYIMPSKVKAYKAFCDSDGNKSTTETRIACICAKRVLADCSTSLMPNPELGCFNIPMGPPPPPFCDHFQQPATIKMLPVVSNSFFNPVIKIMVGIGNQKRCDDGTIIDLNSGCIDGSDGVLNGYIPLELGINADGSSKGRRSILYDGKNYSFEAQKEDNRICGLYYGVDGASATPISSACYNIPKAKKPEIVNAPANIDTLLSTDSGIVVSVKVEGYNGGTPFDLHYGSAGGVLHAPTKLKLIRPEIDANTRVFNYLPICYSESGAFVNGTVGSSGVNCPSGYNHSVKLEYKEDSAGKVLCISEQEAGLNEYMVARDHNQIFRIKELGRAFIPHKYSSNKWEVDYSSYMGHMLIEGNTQERIDKIKNIGSNLFFIYPDGATGYSAKYTKLEVVQKTSDIPSDIRGAVNTRIFNEDQARKYGIEDGSGSYTVASTNFVNIIDNRAFFLTSTEENNGQYIAVDPYLRGLCLPNFAYRVYTDITTDEMFDAKFHKCDFVTVEAWGGGAASHIFSGGAFSGASGGYTKGTVKITNPKNKLKLKIGKGGEISNQPGEVTKVYLCNEDDTNCAILLSANGGKSSAVAADVTDLDDSNIFDSDKVLYVEHMPGRSGEHSTVDSLNPNVAQPMRLLNGDNGHYASWMDTNCADSSKISGTDIADRSDIAGMGGCIFVSSNVWQPGANGQVKLTCEVWK